jgi:hypothetical protein
MIAQALDTALNAMIAHEAAPNMPKRRGPRKQPTQQLKAIETLPVVKPRFIAQMIDSRRASMRKANESSGKPARRRALLSRIDPTDLDKQGGLF